jgi:hypothetical protein
VIVQLDTGRMRWRGTHRSAARQHLGRTASASGHRRAKARIDHGSRRPREHASPSTLLRLRHSATTSRPRPSVYWRRWSGSGDTPPGSTAQRLAKMYTVRAIRSRPGVDDDPVLGEATREPVPQLGNQARLAAAKARAAAAGSAPIPIPRTRHMSPAQAWRYDVALLEDGVVGLGDLDAPLVRALEVSVPLRNQSGSPRGALSGQPGPSQIFTPLPASRSSTPCLKSESGRGVVVMTSCCTTPRWR